MVLRKLEEIMFGTQNEQRRSAAKKAISQINLEQTSRRHQENEWLKYRFGSMPDEEEGRQLAQSRLELESAAETIEAGGDLPTYMTSDLDNRAAWNRLFWTGVPNALVATIAGSALMNQDTSSENAAYGLLAASMVGAAFAAYSFLRKNE